MHVGHSARVRKPPQSSEVAALSQELWVCIFETPLNYARRFHMPSLVSLGVLAPKVVLCYDITR